MSSNRLKYDRCAYATEIKESTEPLEYNLFVGKFENCKNCPIGKYGNVLPFGPKTETESELFGINRHNSNCPEKKYQAESHFKNAPLSAAKMCDSIYYITPNNLEKPTSNMLNEKNLALNTQSCHRRKENVEHFADMPNSPKAPAKKHMHHMGCDCLCNYDPKKKYSGPTIMPSAIEPKKNKKPKAPIAP